MIWYLFFKKSKKFDDQWSLLNNEHNNKEYKSLRLSNVLTISRLNEV